MAKSSWLAPILGGISGLGKGLVAQQDWRRQREDAEFENKLRKLKMDQMTAPKPPELHYDSARGGVVDITNNRFNPTPGLPPRAKVAQAPRTITTSRGIYEWNPDAKGWRQSVDPQGQVLMPEQPRPRDNSAAKRWYVSTVIAGKRFYLSQKDTMGNPLYTPEQAESMAKAEADARLADSEDD